jgi:hypothetical protein
MRGGVRTVPFLIAVALIATTAAPAQASPGRGVAGIHQAFHATPASRPSGPVRRFYLTGSQSDQVNKVAGSPTATFGRSKPSGGQDVVQVTSPLTALGAGGWNDRFSAFWVGAFSGRVVGDVQINWYWWSDNPLQFVLAPPVEVSVWADPSPDGTARLIGRGDTTLSPGRTGPALNVSHVAVSGTVKRSLAIQVTTQYADIGEDLRVSYGSASAPSGFAVPAGVSHVAPLPKVPRNLPAPYHGPRLELQSAAIGTQAGEPTIGINKRGHAFVAGGTLTVDTPIAEGGFTPDVRRSTDGGKTWKSVQPRLPDGTAEPPTSADPYLYVDPSTGRLFNDSLTVACTYLTYSDDEGSTWNRNPAACGPPVDDHQTLVAGPPPRGVTTSGYKNVLYICSSQNSATSCGRSLNGGATFLPTQGLPYPPDSGCGGAGGHLITDPQGRVFLPTGRCGYPAIAISDDAGDTWTRVAVAQMSAANIQTSVASDSAGNLYYAWQDATNRLPWLSHSTDHGRTWSSPLMVAPPGVQQVNWPTVIAGGRGKIALIFPGTTQKQPPPAPTNSNDPISLIAGPPNNDFRPWNYYVIESTNALASNPIFVSATGNPPSDPIHRGPCGDAITGRCGLMFDFLDVKIGPHGEIWGAEVDTCTHNQGRSGIDCVKRTKATPDGNTGSDSNVGVVVKQISGPSLR